MLTVIKGEIDCGMLAVFSFQCLWMTENGVYKKHKKYDNLLPTQIIQKKHYKIIKKTTYILELLKLSLKGL